MPVPETSSRDTQKVLLGVKILVRLTEMSSGTPLVVTFGVQKWVKK